MISVEEALDKILDTIHILEPERKPILQSMGQVLAEDIFADFDIPPLDNSAMDGYAVRWQDISGTSGARSATLSIVGEVAAGYLPNREVAQGTAVRIMTGAPVPAGADTVVRFEDTDEAMCEGESPGEINILREVARGANIRRAGEDVHRGELVLKAGELLRPQEIGVLASLGRTEVSVIRRPRIAVLATGDELVDLGQPLPPGKIYNSNASSTAAQVLRHGGVPQLLGIGTDDRHALREKIALAMDADLLITSGGVSVGAYDVVKDVLAELGDVAFWTVRMKPGKPLAFGTLNQDDKRIPHLGLPGNPVSAMITFEQFARPAIMKMLGKESAAIPVITATSESRIKNTDGRRIFARAIVRAQDGLYYARSTGPQGSGILTSMSKANGLIVVPEDVEEVVEGDSVMVQMLDWERGGIGCRRLFA